MSWFRIDDQSPFDPDVVSIGNEAWGAFCRMGAHCAARLTDGFVMDSMASVITTKKIIRQLIAVGFLAEVEGGFQIRSYLKYNPTAEQERSKKAARAQAGSKGGQSTSQAKRQANATAKTEQNSTPTPTPTPDPKGEETDRLSTVSRNGTKPPLESSVVSLSPQEYTDKVLSGCPDELPFYIAATTADGVERPLLYGVGYLKGRIREGTIGTPPKPKPPPKESPPHEKPWHLKDDKEKFHTTVPRHPNDKPYRNPPLPKEE